MSVRQDAQPLVWWNRAQLDELCGGLAPTWSAWAGGWVRDATATNAAAALAYERPDCEKSSWVPLGARGGAAAWIRVRTGPVADVFETLFAGDPGPAGTVSGADGIGPAVASRAWGALADALRDTLDVDVDAGSGQPGPDAWFFKPWSGGVVVTLAGAGRLPRTLLLNAACVRSVLGPSAGNPARGASGRAAGKALVPLARALAGRKLPLRIELSSCELDFGSLEGLRIGDIVPLPHSLEAPLMVSTAQHARVCAGFLGRQGGFKAIELAREAPADHEGRIDQHLQKEA